MVCQRRRCADELADDDAAVVFSEEDARREVESAEPFAADAIAYPRTAGWAAPG